MRHGRGYPLTRVRRPRLSLRLPAHDNSAQSAAQLNLANNTAFTWGHTVSGGYGIVAVTGNVNSTTGDLTTPATVTFGGVTLTELGGAFTNAISSTSFVRVFHGFGIPVGGQTVSVTFNQSGTTFSGSASSYTYHNVAAVGALQTAAGASTTPSVSVAAGIGDVVWGLIMRHGTPTTFNAFSLTQRQVVTSGIPNWIAGDATADTTTEAVSATITSGGWAATGLQLIGS